MKDFVRELLISTFQECCKAGELTGGELPDFVVEVPRNKDHGDVAVNIAMVLAKQEKRAPREIAQILVSKIGDGKGLVEKTEIAGPGFINVYLKDAVWHTVLQKIDAQAEQFGAVDVGGGEKVLLEFVSANPTGPLHIGHGRGAALGDVLGRVL
ncbi:MAG: arginine--tRNA ligase, partial [bacterium]|nr:arginine--tRNA ligase [bacterium]